MINKLGQIEVPVGYTFSDGEISYRAIRPRDCELCCFFNAPHLHFTCEFLACMGDERSDGRGVHFIMEGGEE